MVAGGQLQQWLRNIDKVLKPRKKIIDHRMPYLKLKLCIENQVVYPDPKGSKLIFFTPFVDGVNEEK